MVTTDLRRQWGWSRTGPSGWSRARNEWRKNDRPDGEQLPRRQDPRGRGGLAGHAAGDRDADPAGSSGSTAKIVWPENNTLSSVVAPLVFYVATDMSVAVPCSTAAQPPESGGVLLSTLPAEGVAATARGLFVNVTNDALQVIDRNVVILSALRAAAQTASNCRVVFTGNADGVRARPSKDSTDTSSRVPCCSTTPTTTRCARRLSACTRPARSGTGRNVVHRRHRHPLRHQPHPADTDDRRHGDDAAVAARPGRPGLARRYAPPPVPSRRLVEADVARRRGHRDPAALVVRRCGTPPTTATT